MKFKSKIFLITAISLALFGLADSSLAANEPVILFSDLTDGPTSGWEGNATKGAAVSIWGRNFGSSRGSSYVSVGGVNLTSDADYAEWAATTNPTVPLGMQRITFWLNSDMVTGGAYPNNAITVTVNGATSNALAFHTRAIGSSKIYFVSTSGSDSNTGLSVAQSKATPGWLRANMTAGDVAYLKGGVYSGVDCYSIYCSGVMYFYNNHYNNGTQGNSISIASYPTEVAQLGKAVGEAQKFVSRQGLKNDFTIEHQPAAPTKIAVAYVTNDENFSSPVTITVCGTVSGSPDCESEDFTIGTNNETTKIFSNITSVTASYSFTPTTQEVGIGVRGSVNAIKRAYGVLSYRSFSKLKMEGYEGSYVEGIMSTEGSAHVRLVGNDATTSWNNLANTNGPFVFEGGGAGSSNIAIYGNYLHDPQSDTPGEANDRRQYLLYIGGYGSLTNIDIGWNDFGKNVNGRGFQIYGHTCDDTLTNLMLHDNYFHNHSRQNATVGGGEGCGSEYSFVHSASIWNNVFSFPGEGDVSVVLGGIGAGRFGGDFKFYNNTIYSPNSTNPPLNITGHMDSLDFKNNITYGHSVSTDFNTGFPDFDHTPVGAYSGNNNLYYNGRDTVTAKVGTWDNSTIPGSNPAFATASPVEGDGDYADYALSAGSSAINAGSSLVSSIVTRDFLGLLRPQNSVYDIGAFEYDENSPPPPPDTTPPAAPSGLAVS